MTRPVKKNLKSVYTLKEENYTVELMRFCYLRIKVKIVTTVKESKNGKPIVGLVIVRGLKNGENWTDGTILDPANGKRYSCNISLREDGNLNIRGYLGFSLLGRTQVWRRKTNL